jgi:regulator of sigma E protease
MLGEEDPQYPRSLASKSVPARILILSAGSLMNILLPIILFAISFMVPHNTVYETVKIEEVAQGSPAQAAGVETGDIILGINEHEISNRGQVGYYIQLNLGKPIDMLLKKADGSTVELSVMTRWKPPEGQGATGITIRGVDSTIVRESLPVWKAIPQGFVHCWEILVLFKNEVVGWFTKDTAPLVAGPVAIAQMTGEFVKAGLSPLIEFAALISISLGIANLLPFPALDGGRLAFVVLEWVRRGRRISPQKEGFVHLVGFFILIALILVVTYNDILRIIQGESLIP